MWGFFGKERTVVAFGGWTIGVEVGVSLFSVAEGWKVVVALFFRPDL